MPPCTEKKISDEATKKHSLAGGGGGELASFVNPQMARMSIDSWSIGELDGDAFSQSYEQISKARKLNTSCLFRIGIVINTIDTNHRSVAAIDNPASSCTVTCLAVLGGYENNSNSNNGNSDNNDDHRVVSTENWLRLNNLKGNKVQTLWGEKGFKDIVHSTNVDALYMIMPTGLQRPYVLAALGAGKHVMVSDLQSTSLDEFMEQLEKARRYKKFIQFSTALVQNYRVKVFMDCVLREKEFGRIQSIDAQLTLNSKDIHFAGELPLDPQGCIRRLGRYCILFGTLLFIRVGSHAVSAKVNKVDSRNSGETLSISCTVKFSEGRLLTFNVGYRESGATRQRVNVHSEPCYATMTDFVFPHRDGLASYRVYNKRKRSSSGGQIEIGTGRSVDVPGGPPQDVIMWRTFCQLSRSLDNAAKKDDILPPETEELASVALQTKRILLALSQSIEKNLNEVSLNQLDT